MKHIWIINMRTSTTLYYKNYSEMKIDPDLLSGMLTALNSFSAIELQSTGISSIEMGGLRWVYHTQTEMNIMLIGADEMSANSQVMRSRLQIIYKMFVEEFDLTAEKMNKELINVQKFLIFETILDMLRQQWQMAESQFGPAQLFDLLGIFQQIFNSMTDIIKFNFYGESNEKIMEKFEALAESLKEDNYIQKNPEYEKIKFYRKTGWEVINLNPMNLDGEELNRVLFSILGRMKEILMGSMSKMSLLYAFNKYIYPFIINQYEMIDSVGILQAILNMFLIN